MRARCSAFATGKRLAAVAAATVAIGAGLVAAPAGADTIEVPIEQVAVKGDPGSTVTIGSAEVTAELQGRSCEVAVEVTNQDSKHPGNTLVITSGESRIEIPGIEDTPNDTTTGGGTLTLGKNIVVAVQLGNSNITSLGSSLTVTCNPLPEAPPPPAVDGEPTYTG